jgi:hypothetical protein
MNPSDKQEKRLVIVCIVVSVILSISVLRYLFH